MSYLVVLALVAMPAAGDLVGALLSEALEVSQGAQSSRPRTPAAG